MEQSALTVSAGLVLLSLVRLFVLSGSWNTLKALLTSMSPVQVLGGSVLVLASAGGAAGLASRCWLERRRYGTPVALAASAAAVLVSPIGVVAVYSATTLAVLGLLRWKNLKHGPRKPKTPEELEADAARLRGVIWLTAILTFVLTVIAPIWLPSEAVETTDGVHVGYVLDADDGGFLVILEHASRRVLHLPTSTIQSRSNCSIDSFLGSRWTKPVAWWNAANDPRCPKPST